MFLVLVGGTWATAPEANYYWGGGGVRSERDTCRGG